MRDGHARRDRRSRGVTGPVNNHKRGALTMAGPDLKDISKRMDGAFNVLKTEFAGLRTGRASTSLLEPITVDAYGSQVPLNQVGTVGVPEPRLLTVQVWDRNMRSEERRVGKECVSTCRSWL